MREAEVATEEALERSPVSREQKLPPVRAGDVPVTAAAALGPFPSALPERKPPAEG